MIEGRARAVVDAVLPAVDGGRFRAKCIAGEPVRIEAHCFTDGHDRIAVALRWQNVAAQEAYEVDMTAEVNDVWSAQFTPPVPGRYRYTVSAWVDHFESWRRELERRNDLADIRVALTVGAELIDAAAVRAGAEDAAVLANWAAVLRSTAADDSGLADVAAMQGLGLDPAKAAIMKRYQDRSLAASTTLELTADRPRAQFS
ncbi:MAG TPA: maltotransferase domain-containing protein, partial [Steroidobacteraceae bacterium]|nr:maltotransferase domain-containing protein [Steroidobacteraceae bacterium]